MILMRLERDSLSNYVGFRLDGSSGLNIFHLVLECHLLFDVDSIILIIIFQP